MSIAEALKEVLHRSKLTQRVACEKADGMAISTLTSALGRNAITAINLIKLANAAGYAVMLVNKSAVGFEPPIEITLDNLASGDE